MSKSFNKPKKFDRNLIVIGAGSAGLVSAYIGTAVKARVTLIEKNKMGGDCLNTGCVPSKALIRSAKLLSQMQRAQDYGFNKMDIEFDFANVMERIQRVIKRIEPHDSIERYTGLGVECISGNAKITSPWSVEVNDQCLTTRNIIIAAGASPFVPPIPGIENIDYLTSDNIWQLRDLPRKLIVLGGGPIGCELAQCFARFGCNVTQVEMLPRIMPNEDPEISQMVTDRFQAEGIRVLVNCRAKAIRNNDNNTVIVCELQGKDIEIEFDRILVAVGRKPNTAGYGLEELGIALTGNGSIETNEYQQTSCPNIFACGDVAGPYQFTHVAAHQAWYATVNALFGAVKKFKTDYSVIPWATFTEPEVARVGLNETQATANSVKYELTKYALDDLDRAITDDEAYGLIKVLTVPGKDRILGATIVGDHAGDIISEYISAMRHGIGLNKILGTIHIYPTLAEANKYAAGVWKQAHAPRRLLKFAEWFHTWQRR